ncbi:MAG: hypothetical protein QOI13_2609 [Paraburkholderia sp.]|nr:hypothetical protein [Paraburkholderia sp.]
MTFSIVGRCARTGELGVAVSTAVPAVGAMCPYLRPNVGAVTTQSWVNPYLALMALDRLEQGDSAEQALAYALRADPSADLRQIGIVDRNGHGSVWTGASCTGWAGDRRGQDYTVQGNMLIGPDTVDAMADAFEASQKEGLGQRLLLALEAGQKAGGDKRGRQSAALKVMGEEAYAMLDLRVDEHPNPVTELRRVFAVAQQQFVPFVAGMPTRDDYSRSPSAEVTALRLTPPTERPGARRLADADMQSVGTDSEVLARWMGTRFAEDRIPHNLNVYRGIVDEITRLRELDLAALHPAILFDPLRSREPDMDGETNE